MKRTTKIKKAQPKIEAYLDGLRKHIFSFNELAGIVVNKGFEFDLSVATTPAKFIDFLIENSHMRKLEGFVAADRYVWRKETADNLIYELALSLRPRSYLSHYTAMFLNNLTEQIPKTIYVTFERASYVGVRKTKLTQSAIDAAFQKEPRKTAQVYNYQGYRIVLINAYRNDHIGVQKMLFSDGIRLPVSNMERTLIDAIVRPEYSGGIWEVCKAFRSAKDLVQANRIKAYIKNLKYVYPIQQSVGFLMEHVGFSENKTEIIRKMCTFDFRFYLERKMKTPVYSEKWHIFYPDNI